MMIGGLKTEMKLFLHQIWMILTLDCEGSARLTSESMDRPLNWAERWAVRMHRLVCAKSRRLNRQLLQMHQKLKQLHPELQPNAFGTDAMDTAPMEAASGKELNQDAQGLSKSAKDRIREKLSRTTSSEVQDDRDS